MLALIQMKTKKNKPVRGEQNLFGTSHPCFHPRKVHVHRTSELYFTRRKVEARAECIASGNIIALVSVLGARSSIAN